MSRTHPDLRITRLEGRLKRAERERDEARAEAERLRLMVEGLAGRVARQAELLSRRAEGGAPRCQSPNCLGGWVHLNLWEPCPACLESGAVTADGV